MTAVLSRPAAVALALAAISAGGCGGGSGGPGVGSCIDGSGNVVDCGSSAAQQKLVTDLSSPDALSCSQTTFGPSQTQVTVDGKQFCAEPVH